MGWLIALALLVGLAILPLGISARYDASGALVRLLVGPVRITLYPRKGKSEKIKAQTSQSIPQQPQEPGGKLSDFLPIVRAIFELLTDARHKMRVKLLQLHLVLAEEDPCDLGVHYGYAWAALEGLLPQAERFFRIQKRDLQIDCDFTAQQTRISARVDLTITLGGLLTVSLRHGSKVLREFLKITKLRKGGAQV